ncbi:DEAD/DEAH box helicase [Rufibacter tibetensis]|uniref:DEAD/DEAH box helicase n=1 Tax=Rufibacter tibetensis TaxID=512763 RepID=A0A0P0CBC9_9BACT|nr:DEAD/DEAH box helicase [Rufibacter tibetensis]ALI98929.1 hypothetical protein DC20_07990 [Rufibacter tibetensis]
MASTLPNRIYQLPSFQRQLKSLLKESVIAQFDNLENTQQVGDEEIDWNNLISCASILAHADDQECLDAALRIAQHCLLRTNSSEMHKVSAGVILDVLTNKPALSLALKRQLIPSDYLEQVPFSLKLESAKRNFLNTYITHNDELLYFNKFQKAVYDATQESDIVSISAPTSSGKSFVLSRLILDALMDKGRRLNVVYLVPTRALVTQVENELRHLLIDNDVKDVFVSSVPKITFDVESYRSTIFVFTQERLHWFKVTSSSFRFDILIVDEAQKIGDGYRGILLQQKIEELVKESPELKVYFSSPFTSNPELLLDIIKTNNTKAPVKKDYVAVNQNLLFVSQKPGKPQKYDMALCIDDTPISLGEFNLPFKPSPVSKILPFVAYSLSNGLGGNLIYANGQADAEKYAVQLYGLCQDISTSEEINGLINLVIKVVHPRYKLAQTLRRRVAFHYGNMPLIVKQEIERLFGQGEIHFLVCTSTLLEGVNLPARSIYIKNPTRGSRQPMNENDFWNLAGRAGRLGKEFQGNIVCVDPYKWNNIPSTNRSKQTIYKAIDNVPLTELINYIEAGTPRKLNNTSQNLEYAFTYYFTKALDNELASTLNPDNPLSEALEFELGKVRGFVELPRSVIFRNPGVSPIAQQNLLNYFKLHSNKDELIPVAPDSYDAVDVSYERIVNLISMFLTGDSEKMSKTYAILVVNWMKGLPLPKMIDDSYKYWIKVQKPKPLDGVIRDTMDLIENYARFKFAKYSNCYLDILHFHLEQENNSDLIEELPDLSSWLEYGVSLKTQISLIDLGLSRPTTLALSEYIPDNNLTREDCILWIKSNDIDLLGLPTAMVNELNTLFSLISRE